MEETFQRILSQAKKSERSRLEPYRELIEQLRERGLTYRDISDILTKELQVQVPKSTINDFVHAQARQRKNAARRLSRRAPISPPPLAHSAQRPSDDNVRQRIAALKARKPIVERAVDGFQYNPDEPLRLINPDKRNPYD